MKKSVFAAALIFLAASVGAAADSPGPGKKTLQEDVFSVSTEDLDLSESLNRVSGQIDTGYSSPEQSFHSKDHGQAGPFARQKAEMSSDSPY